MSTFLTVLALIIGATALLCLFIWSVLVWPVGLDCGWRVWTCLLHSVVAVLAAAMIIAWAINTGGLDPNDADHCGPGTHYVPESHYTVAAKTSVTDWMCVA